jgi:hypothetical protein
MRGSTGAMRTVLLLSLSGVLWGCEKPPAVYGHQIASCEDDNRRAEQMRSVRGRDPISLKAAKDAVVLAEWFVERCHPNPYDPPAADQPVTGTVGEIIEYQRERHNERYPGNPL